jgi:4-hydroxybenzoate polyprenyltransferase
MKILNIINNYGKMVKFSHTLFALPFAGLSMIIAILSTSLSKDELYLKSILIFLCMVSARNAAMGFNRYVDREIDKHNPRTMNRELPAGILSNTSVIIFTILFTIIFIVCTYFLNMFCFYASFPTLLIIFIYSYTKRFTWFCHYVLGIGIGLAPSGAWTAITGEISLIPIIWTLGLMFHIAGFDILYSTQDMEYDKNNNLFSIPSRFGLSNSLYIARINHLFAFSLLFYAGILSSMANYYYIFLIFAGILFTIEHLMVNKNDLSKVPIAFFHINASISIVLFLGILFDKWNELQLYMGNIK